MEKSIKLGFIWTALEKFSLQIVQFVIGFIIARFITPSEYGILGVLMVFVTISQVFIESGLGSALVYKNNLDEDDLQTTFTFNLVVSAIIIILTSIFSNDLERLIGVPNLAEYLIICILVLLPNAFIVVPTSILKVKMNFKAIAVSNVISTIISGGLGIAAAVKGYGVWALVAQLLSKSILQFILMSIQCRWMPRLKFRRRSFVSMYKYSFAIFGTSCLTRLTEQGISLFIARILTTYSLGIYTRAAQFASFAGNSLGSIFSTVLFPAYASKKDNAEELHSLMMKMTQYQGVLVIPVFFFLAVLSKPIVYILLTDRWADVVLVLQILCIGRILSTVAIATEQAVCSVGRSDLEFKQQFFKLMIKVIFIAIGFIWGLVGIAIADALSTLLSFFITNYFASKCLKFGSIKQLKCLAPFIIGASFASIITYPIIQLVENEWLQLIIGGMMLIALYTTWLYATQKSLLQTMIKQND